MSLLEKSYCADDIALSLAAVGVQQEDIVFSHVSLSGIGVAKGCSTASQFFSVIMSGVQKSLGPKGTFIVPTYSYSFMNDDIFDPSTTPSTVGPFTEFFRQHDNVVRSYDPLFSVAAMGPKAKNLISDLPATSFGEGCVYDRLLQQNALIVNIGLNIEYLTFLHFVERKWGATYRFDKQFSGTVLRNGKLEKAAWTYFVRILNDNTVPNLKHFRDLAKKRGLLKTAPLGRGHVEGMRCSDIKSLIWEMLDRDPWSMVMGPPFNTDRAF